ncbi:type III secretion system cytoplasmic ring protein SctQ [Mycetohabitans sp. B2]|uniref:type III secretion system cytoplasmic ring protein SctQ n=1 Tax=Mycetohabitans sp. B2 TaxID=2841274 RepID=UPI001F02B2C8|nr:type III secretion system cytoplasmic ring protein SctQ [Mycetohabitans sp. B2]MCF7697518.1 type III secretion system cytoplasmic ring protein SctQ [Mycetohabitans sp. B2]
MINPTVDSLHGGDRNARWRPHALQPAAARAAQLFCDNRLPKALEELLGGEQWTVTLEPMSASAANQFGTAAWAKSAWLELAHPCGRLRIGFDIADYPLLEPVIRSDGSLDTDGSRDKSTLRLAIAQILVQPVLTALSNVGFKDLHLNGIYRATERNGLSDHPPIDRPTARTTFVHDGRVHAATIVLDVSLLHLAQNFFDNYYAAAQRRLLIDYCHPFADVRLPGRLIVGCKTMTVAMLSTVAPGDVILRAASADIAHLATGAHAAVRATVAWGTPGLVRVHAQAEIDGYTLSILKEPYMTEDVDLSPANDTLTAETRDEVISVGELELPVQLEIDTIALPLSDIYALRTGYVLELPSPVDTVQIKLVTHGRTIGYAELVSVGDHLGIRILRMVQGNVPAQ